MSEIQANQTLPFVRASELELEPPDQHWLIEGLWGRSAIGIIGGTPKLGKSWLGLEMAVSVASGTHALGHFPTPLAGPALVYLAEDSLPHVRARIQALCNHRGLEIAALDLHVITAPSLRIDLEADQRRLAATIERLRPRLVVLDPLVRIHHLDENSSADISRLLGYIRELQRRFDTAIALVHHASKKARADPGQALRGSSDLHAVGDSNAYLARRRDALVLTLEHRSSRPPDPMEIELVTDDQAQSAHLRVKKQGAESGVPADAAHELAEAVLKALEPGGPAIGRTQLRAIVRVNNQRLGAALDDLAKAGRIERTALGWRRL